MPFFRYIIVYAPLYVIFVGFFAGFIFPLGA
jgi:hypothetical protein